MTDAQWARIEPLPPDRTPKRGGRWRDHREAIDAIAFKFQTGSQWVHLPERYGNWRARRVPRAL
ncbi:transposase [Streptomyces inusitatus]|uniref:transposase n=1 Tax=Streptomyces inusitatus TaxID=68221 RepID=UPI00357151D9